MIRVIAVRCALVIVLAFSALAAFSTSAVSFGAPPTPGQASDSAKAWVAPDPATIPEGPLGDSIRLGMRIFNNTPKYAEKYVGNKMSCTHCHIDGGTVSQGMPMVGLPGIFPMYRDREKIVITFEERIQQCFQRSETGHRLPNDGPDSYSDGAGMNQIPKMAAFVQHNMPQNQPDSLTPQEAYDVATYIHSKPHTVFNMKDHQ
jgi:thiosulfate dehydrogenase